MFPRVFSSLISLWSLRNCNMLTSFSRFINNFSFCFSRFANFVKQYCNFPSQKVRFLVYFTDSLFLFLILQMHILYFGFQLYHFPSQPTPAKLGCDSLTITTVGIRHTPIHPIPLPNHPPIRSSSLNLP